MLQVNQLVGLGAVHDGISPPTGPTFFNTVQLAGSPSYNSRSGYTLVTKIPGTLVPSAAYVRVTLESNSIAAPILSGVTIGHRDTTTVGAAAWDSASVTSLLWQGASTWTAPASPANNTPVTYTLDVLALTITAGVDLLLAVNMGAVSNATARRTSLGTGTGALVGIVCYEKSGVQEAGTADRGGSYASNSNQSFFLNKIEFGT